MASLREKDAAKWELCDVRYVRWRWVLGIVMGTIGIIATLSFSAGSWGKGVESRIEQIETRCLVIQRIDDNIDTIKTMLKKQEKQSLTKNK